MGEKANEDGSRDIADGNISFDGSAAPFGAGSNLVRVSSADHNKKLAESLWKFFRTQHRVDFQLNCGGGLSQMGHAVVLDSFLTTEKLSGRGLTEPNDGHLHRGIIPESLLEFLYRGEVVVPEEELECLFRIARDLDFRMFEEAIVHPAVSPTTCVEQGLNPVVDTVVFDYETDPVEVSVCDTDLAEVVVGDMEVTEVSVGDMDPLEVSVGDMDPLEAAVGDMDPLEAAVGVVALVEAAIRGIDPAVSAVGKADPSQEVVGNVKAVEAAVRLTDTDEVAAVDVVLPQVVVDESDPAKVALTEAGLTEVAVNACSPVKVAGNEICPTVGRRKRTEAAIVQSDQTTAVVTEPSLIKGPAGDMEPSDDAVCETDPAEDAAGEADPAEDAVGETDSQEVAADAPETPSGNKRKRKSRRPVKLPRLDLDGGDAAAATAAVQAVIVEPVPDVAAFPAAVVVGDRCGPAVSLADGEDVVGHKGWDVMEGDSELVTVEPSFEDLERVESEEDGGPTSYVAVKSEVEDTDKNDSDYRPTGRLKPGRKPGSGRRVKIEENRRLAIDESLFKFSKKLLTEADRRKLRLLRRPLLRCQHCTYETRVNQYFQVHLARHDPTIEIFRCGTCSQAFLTSDALQRHKKKHAIEIYACPHCDYKNRRESRYLMHLAKHDSSVAVFRCSICLAPFFCQDSMTRHELKHAQSAAIAIHKLPFTCPICAHVALSAGALKRHLRFKHRSFPSNANGERAPPHPQKIKSEPVDVKKEILPSAAVVVDDSRPYRCGLCSFAAKRQATLKRHNIDAHPPPDVDEDAFQQPAVRRRLKKPPSEKTFSCRMCGRCFARPSGLETHTKKVHRALIAAAMAATTIPTTTAVAAPCTSLEAMGSDTS